MTRTMGWLSCGLAMLALVVLTGEAEARHRRGGSDGGYGSFGGGGSFGGNGSFGGHGHRNGSDGGSWGRGGSAGGRGSFGGIFSRQRGGDCYSDHGSSGGHGSNGGSGEYGSHGGHGSHSGSYYSEPSAEGGNEDPGQPPAAPEMSGDEAAPSASADATPSDREI